jgi:hypothetical protein
MQKKLIRGMTLIQNKKCEVAAVLLVKRLGPQTGVQLSHPKTQCKLLMEADRYG